MDREELIQSVIEFVAAETSHPRKKTSVVTDLVHDVGMAGDEAVEFLIAFSERFNVRVTMDIERAFGPEAEVNLYDLIRLPLELLRYFMGGCRQAIEPTVTVGDLVSAVEKGELHDRPRNVE